MVESSHSATQCKFASANQPWRSLCLFGVVALGALAPVSCSGSSATVPGDGGGTTDAAATADVSAADAYTTDGPADSGPNGKGVVYVVLFTHIEDQSPSGTIGTEPSRANYASLRSKLIEVAQKAAARKLQWVLEPDWKVLVAAQQYEDATTMATTNNKNFLRYLREDLGVVIDPHSHENGYNYTDVAHLLEVLGVGGSTVIGGHIWDPALPQFQQWDRFRSPVAGMQFPTATWRGDILIGAGTPAHSNDPIASGVWRPKDRNNFFVDDPAGNIASVGAFHNDVSGVQELVELYATGKVAPSNMLTASWNVTPSEITAPGGVDDVDTKYFKPIAAMRDAGTVKSTDFSTLVKDWKTKYGATASLYRQ